MADFGQTDFGKTEFDLLLLLLLNGYIILKE